MFNRKLKEYCCRLEDRIIALEKRANDAADGLKFYVNYDNGEDPFEIVEIPLRMVVGHILQSLDITMTKLEVKDTLIVKKTGVKIYPT